VAVHGHPRYTKDLDIWVECSQDNAVKIIAALTQFGFESLGLASSDFIVPGQVIQLGYPPNRIDLLTSVDGVEFDAAYSTRIMVMLNDILVAFIDLEHLKQNKKATARAQDLADLEALGGE
jgi:hypothetical protein